MIQDFFTPIPNVFLETELFLEHSLGHKILKHSETFGFPDLATVNIAFFDVKEERGAVNNSGTGIGADEIRKQFYQLFLGNWNVSIADLGTIESGNELSDTYYAIQKSVSYLIKNHTLPIVIGGSQDLIYANYKAYDTLEQAVNLASVSPNFGFGKLEETLSSRSYLSKIILENPCNLFNYANLGYQTYYNTQEDIALIETLNFESYRLGDLKDITIVEPLMRDADIVAIDISTVKASDVPANANANPNGISGEDACAIARYAGISDKVTSFGIYEYNKLFEVNNRTSKLISQMIWYFIEGYSLRKNDYPYGSKENYLKYLVPFEDEILTFFQSDKSQRWWMQIDIKNKNKYDRHLLTPCSREDYLNVVHQKKLSNRLFNILKKII